MGEKMTMGKLPKDAKLLNFVTKWGDFLFYPLIKPLYERIPFKFDDFQHYPYMAIYNVTPSNERQVEIPIVMKKINMLEVGNVLNHYKLKWDVVDKFEKAPGVINQDILNYNPGKKYDKIVSISTLEHVGGRKRILKAIKKLKSLLNKGGHLVFTVPIGWNTEMDWLISHNKLGVSMKFMYLNNYAEWHECEKEIAMGRKYGGDWAFANAIMVGEWRKK